MVFAGGRAANGSKKLAPSVNPKWSIRFTERLDERRPKRDPYDEVMESVARTLLVDTSRAERVDQPVF